MKPIMKPINKRFICYLIRHKRVSLIGNEGNPLCKRCLKRLKYKPHPVMRSMLDELELEWPKLSPEYQKEISILKTLIDVELEFDRKYGGSLTAKQVFDNLVFRHKDEVEPRLIPEYHKGEM